MRTSVFSLAIFIGLANPTLATSADDLEAARLALRVKQFSVANATLATLANSGNPQAQYLLGLAKANGLDGSVDLPGAIRLLRAAAEQGIAEAAFAASGLLADGTAAERHTEAQSWLDRAVSLGYPPAIAQRNIGVLPMSSRRDATGLAANARFELATWAIGAGDDELLMACKPGELAAAIDAFGRTLLHWSAETGGAANAAKLLATGYRVDARDEFGVTPLMLAAESGKNDVLDLLLLSGANAALVDKVGRSAIFRAALVGNLPAIRTLAKNAANMSAADQQGWTALDVAMRAEKSEAIVLLQELGATANVANVVSPRSSGGMDPSRPGLLYQKWPALFVAVSRNDVVQIRRLLAEDGRAVAQTPQGDGILHVAVEAQAKDAIKMLLAAGADPNKKNSAGESPLDLAARRGDMAMLELLMSTVRRSSSSPEAMLMAAVRRGNVESVRGLLAFGANADARDPALGSALLQAVVSRHEQIVQILLASGASAAIADKHGRSPLWHAAFTGQASALQSLLVAKAPINQGDSDGVTPLGAAAKAGFQGIASSLLGAGASVNVRANAGDTPLFLAAAAGQANLVRFLLRSGASVNVPNKYGDTALIAAARRGSADVCALLLQAGADARLRNKDRANATEVASGRGFDAITKLLDAA